MIRFIIFLGYPEVIFDNNVDKVYATEGENLTVICRAYGNPNPMLHWEASNIELTVPEDSQSVLYLYRIERHQQLLTCHAVSLSKKYGQLVTTKPIEIEVFCKSLRIIINSVQFLLVIVIFLNTFIK